MIAVSEPGFGGSRVAAVEAVDELDARLRARCKASRKLVPRDTAIRNLRVAKRHATEHYDKLRMFGDNAPPRRLRDVISVVAADDVRHQGQCCVIAVIPFRADEAAELVE